jgi:peptide-methionine (R)-S-oxide reductase
MMSRRTILSAVPALAGLMALLPARPLGAAGGEPVFPVTKSDAEWRQLLTAAQYRVLREHGTEAPGSSALDKEYRPGIYRCAGCATPMYSSKTKFNSGTGWPSFWAPLDGAVGTSVDNSWLMRRTEVHCATCGGHLGHVFDDGPPPTGQRYCINSVSLKLAEAPETDKTPGD